MHNPLRSEADAFRMVVISAAARGAVIALTLLTRPRYGAVLGAALIGVGIGLAWRGSRGAEPRKAEVAPRRRRDAPGARGRERDGRGQGAAERDPRTAARGRRQRDPRRHARRSRSPVEHWVSDTDQADRGRRRSGCERRWPRSRRPGSRPAARSATPTPTSRSRTRCAASPADELIISTHPPERSRWLERGVVERAREEIDLPVTHVVVDLEGRGG